MKVAICDDEELFIKNFTNTLRQQENISTIYGYSNPNSLLSDIEAGHSFEIVFMDIQFAEGGKNGIEYALDICKVLPYVQIIFITGYNNYSQDIFQKELNLCGFLLKKVDEEKLAYLIRKSVKNCHELKNGCLEISNKKATYVIPFRHIIFVESKGHMVTVHTGSEEIISYCKLDDIMAELPVGFVRCHKSYLVNLDEIARLEAYKVILSNRVSLPISRTRYQDTRDSFFAYIKSLM